MDVDLAVVGAGGAGLSLLLALDRLGARSGRPTPSIALVDPVHRRADDRTWCFWEPAAAPPDPAVHRAWSRAELVDVDGRPRTLDLAPLRYVMLRSSAFYARADAAADRLRAVRVEAAADEVHDGLVRAGGVSLRARWIVDSRPARPHLPATVPLLQHFRGWTVRLDRDTFDPDVPVLMDFSVPQPEHGVAFGYVLPTDARCALVEYTEFSRARLPGAGYDRALRAYLGARYAVTAGDYRIDHVEDGVVPMTDAVHARRAGRSTFRLGTAGGATRGSTGYTFAAMQRQAAAVADALLAGRVPLPPRAYPGRHRWMDAVLLRALDGGLVDGPRLFEGLFRRNPPERVLRFLDGTSGPVDEVRVMMSAPVAAMVRATAGDVRARVRRRFGGSGR